MAVAKPPKTASASQRAPKKAEPKRAKPAVKAPAMPVAKRADTPSGVAAKAEKPKKPKLVRDSFTIPKAEYKVIQECKDRAAALGRPVKKSELLRAGLKALAAMGDAGFGAALDSVPALKTGRPAKI